MSTWVTSWSSSRCLPLSGGKGPRCLCGARTCRWPHDAAVGADGLARSPLLECGQDLWYGQGDGLSLPWVPGGAGDCPACRPALGACCLPCCWGAGCPESVAGRRWSCWQLWPQARWAPPSRWGPGPGQTLSAASCGPEQGLRRGSAHTADPRKRGETWVAFKVSVRGSWLCSSRWLVLFLSSF